MEISELKPGKQVEISVERNDMIFHLVSKIEAVQDKTLYCSLIKSAMGTVFLFYPGDSVSIIYRLGDRLWKWEKTVPSEKVLEEDHLHAFTVRRAEGEPFNRRNSFRVFFGEEIDIKRTEPDIEKIKEYRHQHPEIKELGELLAVEELYRRVIVKGTLKDLSETGVGIYSSEKLPMNAELSLMVPTEFGLITLTCVPVRAYLDDNSHHRYFYGCNISTVSNNISRILISVQRRAAAYKRFERYMPKSEE